MYSSLELLERLVSFPTISKTPNIELINFARERLEMAGVACTAIESSSGSNANLYLRIGPRKDGGVLLSGHTDVVPVEGQKWSVEPFKLTERGGRLYGRGTADMKGFVACILRIALVAATRDLVSPLHIALSYDEEIGCVGVRSLIETLELASFNPRLCIVGEPTNLGVATGHKGKIAARATCHGREVHSALAPKGLNAIHLATDLIQALRILQREIERDGEHDQEYEVPYSTVHSGVIVGGTALNIVPSICTVDFEIRHLQSDDPDVIISRIRSLAANICKSAGAAAEIEIDVLNRYPGLDTPIDHDAVTFVRALTGANSTSKVAFGTEGGLFSRDLGIPTVICGPGSMSQGHKPDEFIEKAQIAKCDVVMDALLDQLCM